MTRKSVTKKERHKTSRYGLKHGAKGTRFVGIVLLIFGVLMMFSGILLPVEAHSMVLLFSTALEPKVKLNFYTTNGFRLSYVEAYDYIHDVKYVTYAGSLSLPEGSYVVWSPGTETVVLHLYDLEEKEYTILLEPLPKEIGLDQIALISWLKPMSSIAALPNVPQYEKLKAASKYVVPDTIAANNVLVDEMQGVKHKWIKIECTDIEYTYYGNKIVLRIGNIYLGVSPPELFAQLLQDAKSACEEIKKYQEYMAFKSSPQGASINLLARKGTFVLIKGGFDCRKTEIRKVLDLGEVEGASVSLKISGSYQRYDKDAPSGKKWKTVTLPNVEKEINLPSRINFTWQESAKGTLTIKSVTSPPRYSWEGYRTDEKKFSLSKEPNIGLGTRSVNVYSGGKLVNTFLVTPREITFYFWEQGKNAEEYVVAEAVVEGIVVDKVTGQPVKGIYVYIQLDTLIPDNKGGYDRVPKIISAYSGSDGVFKLKLRIPRGSEATYTLRIGASSSLGKIDFKVKCGEYPSECEVTPKPIKVVVSSSNPSAYMTPYIPGTDFKNKGIAQGDASVEDLTKPQTGEAYKESQREAYRKAWEETYKNYLNEKDPEKLKKLASDLIYIAKQYERLGGGSIASSNVLQELESVSKYGKVVSTTKEEEKVETLTVKEVTEPDGSKDVIWTGEPVVAKDVVPTTETTIGKGEPAISVPTVAVGSVLSLLGVIGIVTRRW
ncbi:MAG: hypothetical protein QXW42_04160 [Thermofilum sp.]